MLGLEWVPPAAEVRGNCVIGVIKQAKIMLTTIFNDYLVLWRAKIE